MMNEDFERFKKREVKAKTIFVIRPVPKNIAYFFVRRYHYLADAKFFSMYSYGLFYRETDKLVGVATFSLPQGNVALKGWFGLPNSDKSVVELSRLCVLPELNKTNATSFLLSGAIRLLKKEDSIRAIITLADSSRHVGSIYQVCNFQYYGLTDKKNDFFRFDGVVNPRGKVSDVHGVWVPRTQKHRYAYILDKTLHCLYEEQPKPKANDVLETNGCWFCKGSGKVFDNRFKEWYTCPRCKEFHKIDEDKENEDKCKEEESDCV